ncbi:hypothetical protein [Kitasatospora sp. NBC_00085]|uniref:hypothetical protein n=1 Tax=unclassified Kitasatospora TaxID=2633591 RepID=UPI00386F5992
MRDRVEEQSCIEEVRYLLSLMHRYHAAERGLVDDVIDPAGTRAMLVALEMLSAERGLLPCRTHGNAAAVTARDDPAAAPDPKSRVVHGCPTTDEVAVPAAGLVPAARRRPAGRTARGGQPARPVGSASRPARGRAGRDSFLRGRLA